MPEQPFFSIVIPTHNRAALISSALDCFINQEFQDFEVIVVDDGGTDNTEEIVALATRRNQMIAYYHKENEERSIARNFGIAKARGRYISFLDSDDKVYPNHLKTAFNLLQRSGFPEVAHLGYEFVDEKGQRRFAQTDFKNFGNRLIRENIAHGNAIFIRRDVLESVSFIPSRFATISEDWYLWVSLAARYQFVFDSTVTSSVVDHSGRSLNNIDPAKLQASTEVIVHHLKADDKFMSAFRGSTGFHFANHYTLLTLILSLDKKRKRETLRYLFLALSYYPPIFFQRRFLASVKHLLLSLI